MKGGVKSLNIKEETENISVENVEMGLRMGRKLSNKIKRIG